jgi:hypothetical protein
MPVGEGAKRKRGTEELTPLTLLGGYDRNVGDDIWQPEFWRLGHNVTQQRQSGLRCTMANKAITASVAAKKPGKTLKEKRAAKAVKAVEKTASRKTWENK